MTLAALLATIAMAWLEAGAAAFELGDVQAVPGAHPPYVFRLPITPNRGDGGGVPSVTVRHPPDVLGVVKNQTLELRLPNLTDVELEISYGGQTLNRLFLTRELQAADAAEAHRERNHEKKRDVVGQEGRERPGDSDHADGQSARRPDPARDGGDEAVEQVRGLAELDRDREDQEERQETNVE